MTEGLLKRCPFCGNAAKIEKSHVQHSREIAVICEYCPAVMSFLNATEEFAVEAWNLRTPISRETLARRMQQNVRGLPVMLPLCLGANGVASWEECSDDAHEAFLGGADKILRMINDQEEGID